MNNRSLRKQDRPVRSVINEVDTLLNEAYDTLNKCTYEIDVLTDNEDINESDAESLGTLLMSLEEASAAVGDSNEHLEDLELEALDKENAKMFKEFEGKTVYISGGISGKDWMKVQDQFGNARKFLEEQGAQVITPMNHTIKTPPGMSDLDKWDKYMRVSIAELMRCDTIFLLEDFTGSKGAMIEYDLSQRLGMLTYYAPDYIED